MKIILSNRAGIISAKRLRNYLQEEFKENICVTKNAEKIEDIDEVLIRYGCSNPIICSDTDFNSRTAIRNVVSKKIFSEKLQEANILVPIFYKTIPEKEDFPLIIRDGLCRSKGRGIIIIKNMEEFEKGSYEKRFEVINTSTWWTPFVKMEYELRVHVVFGKVIKIFKKIPKNSEEEFPIRNSSDYHYKKITTGFSTLSDLCEEVSKILQINLVGLDVGKKVSGGYFFIEGNSAPGLNFASAALVAKKFAEAYKNDIDKSKSDQVRIKLDS